MSPLQTAGGLTVDVLAADALSVSADLLLLPIAGSHDLLRGIRGRLDPELVGSAEALARHVGNSFGSLTVIPTFDRSHFPFLGLYRSPVDGETLREVAMDVGRAVRSFASVVIPLDHMAGDLTTSAIGWTEGLLLGCYEARARGTTSDRTLTQVLLVAEHAESSSLGDSVRRGRVYAMATNQARALVDASANSLTPDALASEGEELVGRYGDVSGRFWRGQELVQGGFGGIAAVGGGSACPPVLIDLRYRGGLHPTQCSIVGKGVTFDTGGLDLKRPDNMSWMKADMAGGAAALNALWACAELRLPIDLHVLVPAVENSVGPAAYRPGDVVRHRNGMTTEVTSPDAEGRVILADALAYAAEQEPAALIDLATLTSAILGPETAAVFSNDAELCAALMTAGAAAGEPLWELPLLKSCQRYLASDVADSKNLVKGLACDPLVAALYLAQFVGSISWGHLDIIGTAYHRTPAGHWPAGATGAGTRTLVRFIEQLASTEAGHGAAVTAPE